MMHELFDDEEPRAGKASATWHGSAASTHKYYPSCFESHKGLKIGPGTVYGGSAGWPIVKDADIYVGLDSSMNFRNSHRYPWHPEQDGPVEVLFRIPDGNAPSDPKEFKAMVEWLAEQLIAGKKIHIGCIGGHGRTGMVLAALVRLVEGRKDAIEYVREHYCKKAVESASQVQFLASTYGVNKVAPSRQLVRPISSGKSLLKTSADLPLFEQIETRQQELARRAQNTFAEPLRPAHPVAMPSGRFIAVPVASLASVWGSTATVRPRPELLAKRGKPVKIGPSQEGA